MRTATSITVRVPLVVRHPRGRRTVVTPDGQDGTPTTRTRSDPAVLKALARGFRWKRMLEAGRYSSITDIAAGEKIDRGYVGSILRLTLLAPDVVEAITDGRQPARLGLPALLEPFPIEWDQQRVHWLVTADIPREAVRPATTGNESAVTLPPLPIAGRQQRRHQPIRRSNATNAGNAAS
jgi:hypothetical protein